MENTKYGMQREGRWTPIPAKAQDTRANPNSWETHLVRKRWDIVLLRALSLWIIMMKLSSLPMCIPRSPFISYHRCDLFYIIINIIIYFIYTVIYTTSVL